MDGLAFTKVTSNVEANNRSMQVWLWDCGPPKPVAPIRPKPPKGLEGEPDYDLGMIEFREAITEYEAALKAYRAARSEYQDFAERFGGPYEKLFWSCDANDALTNDALAVKEGRQAARRWFISSRTRGYENLKNSGLPTGMKPGHGHAENLRREMEANADLLELRRADPVFGATENPQP